MEAGPGRELQGKVQRRSRRLTGQRGCRLVPIRGSQCWQWLGLIGGSVFVSPPASSPPGCRRRQPGGDQFPSPANLIDANRPRGLTRDTRLPWLSIAEPLAIEPLAIQPRQKVSSQARVRHPQGQGKVPNPHTQGEQRPLLVQPSRSSQAQSIQLQAQPIALPGRADVAPLVGTS